MGGSGGKEKYPAYNLVCVKGTSTKKNIFQKNAERMTEAS
jgi:hypothetical protein